jgi:formylglycine-generating enzyme required for sulfatase activity
MRDLDVSGLHPVETVAWGQAMELAARLGCQLPSETQWEHLARAGHGGTWSWVEDPARLPRFANLSDQAARNVFYSPEQKAPWDDGFPVHAPVGSFEPSPFGLHDVLGNVTEWCRSGWRPTEPPDGPGGRPAFRGASWYHAPGMAHFEFREAMAAQAADFTRGLRRVRALDGLTYGD